VECGGVGGAGGEAAEQRGERWRRTRHLACSTGASRGDVLPGVGAAGCDAGRRDQR
jgi:hypothetical protein